MNEEDFLGNYQIDTVEKAQMAYVIAGCDPSSLAEKWPDRYREYLEMNIPYAQELEWKESHFNKMLERFSYERSKEMAEGFVKLKAQLPEGRRYLIKMLEIAAEAYERTVAKDIYAYLKCIIGEQTLDGGLIQTCCLADETELAELYVACAELYLDRIAKTKQRLAFTRGALIDAAECYNLPLSEALKKKYMEQERQDKFFLCADDAKAGVPGSMGLLGLYYRDGIGCVQDERLALYWMEKAYKAGNNDIAEALQELKNKITAKEQDEKILSPYGSYTDEDGNERYKGYILKIYRFYDIHDIYIMKEEETFGHKEDFKSRKEAVEWAVNYIDSHWEELQEMEAHLNKTADRSQTE